jgi:hypothetical protein
MLLSIATFALPARTARASPVRARTVFPLTLAPDPAPASTRMPVWTLSYTTLPEVSPLL